MKIEKEVRYYFSNDKLNEIVTLLTKVGSYTHSYHEVTTMYDNPNPEFTFYSKEVDGRLRVRYSKNEDSSLFGEGADGIDMSQCLITWKRRIANNDNSPVRREEEIEYMVDAKDFSSVTSIFENVLKCKRISSYERIRNFLTTDSVQITCDQFPYGLMVEFELKDSADEQILMDIIKKCDLDINDASSLSCDDKYVQLCKEQGIKVLSDISFADETMPKIK